MSLWDGVQILENHWYLGKFGENFDSCDFRAFGARGKMSTHGIDIVVTDTDALSTLIAGLLRRAFTAHEPAVDCLYLVTVPRIGAPSAVAFRYGAPPATSTGS